MTIDFLYKILAYLSIASVLIPIFYCILKRKALNLILRALFFFLLVSFAFELMEFFAIKSHAQNYISRNIYTIVECSFMAFFYFQIFETKKTKILITFLFGFFLILALFRFVYFNYLTKEDGVVNAYEALFVIGLGWGYLFKLMRELKVYDLREHYFFWLNFAFVIYFSMAFILFLFYPYLEKFPLPAFYFLWGLHLITNIACNILISRGVWKAQLR